MDSVVSLYSVSGTLIAAITLEAGDTGAQASLPEDLPYGAYLAFTEERVDPARFVVAR